ncbi:hypothetical protein KSF78_0008207 [Schistosoma japonicum]|nr:hypothetical protein KSF78_0008207 [Schistosoma japonicum]
MVGSVYFSDLISSRLEVKLAKTPVKRRLKQFPDLIVQAFK